MSNFTRAQLHEYFDTRFTPEQVDKALAILAENGAEIDPNAEEFSIEITDELEKIFDAVGVAVDNQKKLGHSQELTVLEAQAIASKVSQHANPQLMAAMARLVVEETIAQGAALVQLKSDVLGQVLQKGDVEIAKSLLGRTQQTTSFVNDLVADKEKVNKMLSGYGIETVDVDAFLEEVRSGTEGVKQSVKAIAPAQKDYVDVDAFLLEAGK